MNDAHERRQRIMTSQSFGKLTDNLTQRYSTRWEELPAVNAR